MKSSSNQLTNRLFSEKEKTFDFKYKFKKDSNSFISNIYLKKFFYNQADYIIDIENKNTIEVISEIKEKLA